MQVTNLRYCRTIQAAQYEPELLEASAILEDGDDFEKCSLELRQRVTKALGRKTVGPAVAATSTATKQKKKATDKAETPEGDVSREEPPKKRKKKPIAYNREVKAHAAQLGKILHAEFPDWKKDDVLKANAKTASENLVGTDFLGDDGEVLDTFVQAVKDAMSGDEGL